MGVANPAIINAQKQYERAHDTLMVSVVVTFLH